MLSFIDSVKPHQDKDMYSYMNNENCDRLTVCRLHVVYPECRQYFIGVPHNIFMSKWISEVGMYEGQFKNAKAMGLSVIYFSWKS